MAEEEKDRVKELEEQQQHTMDKLNQETGEVKTMKESDEEEKEKEDK
jgi:hypothetical protein